MYVLCSEDKEKKSKGIKEKVEKKKWMTAISSKETAKKGQKLPPGSTVFSKDHV